MERPSEMKIVFDDIIYSLQKAGGASELFSQISKYYSGDICHYYYDNANENILFRKIQGHQYIKKSSTMLQIKRYMDVTVKNEKPFIFHSTNYRLSKNPKAINITTVHDFMYEIYRHDLKSIMHKIQKKKAVFGSDGIICISNNTKKDLMKYYPTFNKPVKVIYNGYDNETYNLKDCPRNKIIIYTGGRKGYKNFSLACRIARELKGYQLILVGGGDLSPEEKELLSGVNYAKYGYMSSKELCQMYNEAFMLLYTSDYEGFGITPIEAQACGCLVACQNKSSLPEVVGKSAITIDTNNIQVTIKQIKSCEETGAYDHYQRLGLDNARRFSWKKTAEMYNAFYKEIAELHK